MSLTLYLLRHGESEANAAHIFAGRAIDPALTQTGRSQAQQQAAALRDIRFAAIYASPLKRAQETATIVGQAVGLTPITSDSLWEADLGEMDGLSYDDPVRFATYFNVLERWQAYDYDAGFPGGETLRDIQARMASFFATLAQGAVAQARKPILIVGHEALFTATVWLFCSDPGPSINAWRLRHAHLAIMSRNGKPDFQLEQFNVAPFEARSPFYTPNPGTT